jgi:hypothetical protein
MKLVRTRAAAVAARKKIAAICETIFADDLEAGLVTTSPTSAAPVAKEQTPNNLHNIPYIGLPSAYAAYCNNIKNAQCDIMSKYIKVAESNPDSRYAILPELMKFIIANPAILIYNSQFADAVINKMAVFEHEMKTLKYIGNNYRITDSYRKQFIGLCVILRKLSETYSRLNLNEAAFYDNITNIADSM